jgi:O-antigen ligase
VTSLAARRRPTGAALAGVSPALVLLSTLAVLGCAGVGVALDVLPLPLYQAVGLGLGMLGALALALWRYHWLVVVALLLLGLQSFDPAPVDGVLVVLISVALVTGKLDLRGVPLWVVATIGAFVILNLLSAMEAVDAGHAAFFMGVSFYLCAFGVWASCYFTTPDRTRLLLTCLIAVGAFSAFFGSLTLFVRVPFFPDIGRALALFDDPNVFGPFVVSISVVLMQELLQPRLLRWPWPIKVLLLAVLVGGVFFSYSRAAWLNWVVAVGVLLVVTLFRRAGAIRAASLMIAVVIGVAAIAATVVLTGSTAFFESRARFQSYDTQRFAAQRRGIELAETHPLGVGPGQFEFVSPIEAHSTYIRAGAEQGPIGFIVVVVLFLGTLLAAARNVVFGRDTAGIGSIGLLAVWCGMLANSFFLDTVHWRHLWLFAGLIWAGSLAAPANLRQASSTAGVRRPM